MPVHQYWLQEPSILGVDYVGAISVEDIEGVMASCIDAVAKQPTYFLIDTTQIGALPKTLLRLNSMIEFLKHPNTRWLVFVGLNNPVVRFAIQLMVHRNVKIMDSREAALAFLFARVQAELTPAA